MKRSEGYMKEYQTYQFFCKELKLAVLQKLPDPLRVDIHKVTKNNNIELDSLVIVSDKSGISPNFYLQNYYEEYKNGRSIETLAEEILSVYFCEIHENIFDNISLAFSDCKEKIFFRLVSYEKNRELLQNIPHRIFLDMAIIYYILFSAEEEGIRSIRVSDSIMKSWELEEEALFLLAKENTPILFPKRICSMLSVISEMMDENAMQEVLERSTLPISRYREKEEPYVLTNEMGINGAAVILYQDVLNEVSQLTGGDFYLLPSSIHEMLVISAQSGMGQRDLEEMVHEVNETCVAEDEILSERIYYYSFVDRRLSLV